MPPDSPKPQRAQSHVPPSWSLICAAGTYYTGSTHPLKNPPSPCSAEGQEAYRHSWNEAGASGAAAVQLSAEPGDSTCPKQAACTEQCSSLQEKWEQSHCLSCSPPWDTQRERCSWCPSWLLRKGGSSQFWGQSPRDELLAQSHQSGVIWSKEEQKPAISKAWNKTQ